MTGVSVGGSAEHVLLLAKTLDPTKYDVHVALWSGGPLDAALVETGLPVHFLDDTADTPTTMTSAKAFSGGGATGEIGRSLFQSRKSRACRTGPAAGSRCYADSG